MDLLTFTFFICSDFNLHRRGRFGRSWMLSLIALFLRFGEPGPGHLGLGASYNNRGPTLRGGGERRRWGGRSGMVLKVAFGKRFFCPKSIWMVHILGWGLSFFWGRWKKHWGSEHFGMIPAAGLLDAALLSSFWDSFLSRLEYATNFFWAACCFSNRDVLWWTNEHFFGMTSLDFLQLNGPSKRSKFSSRLWAQIFHDIPLVSFAAPTNSFHCLDKKHL